MKVGRRAASCADRQDHQKTQQHGAGHQLLEICAQTNSAIVQHSKEYRERHTQRQSRQKHRLVSDAVEFLTIQRREDVCRQLSERDRFPGAHDEIRQQHHPAGEITDDRGKHFCGVRRLTGSIGKPADPLAINVADRQQNDSADHVSQHSAEWPTAP